MDQLDSGKGISHTDVIDKLRKKYNA
jgi:hypothetical protein